MSWQKEFDKRLENNCSDINFYKEENNSFDDEYKKAMNIADDFMVLKNPLEVDFDKIKQFISDLITKTREETIREEIKYWINVFDNRPKDRDLESDNIAQNFARIEIERLENKLKSLINK